MQVSIEILYRFEFPERPGALMKFLKNMKPDWSISIFHYRNHGADVGRIVIGVLINQNNIEDWYELTFCPNNVTSELPFSTTSLVSA